MTTALGVANAAPLHPVFTRLCATLACPVVDVAGFDAFANTDGDQVLFFTGEPRVVPESLDVAVVLPELVRAFPNRFRVAVVDRLAEKPLQAKYRVARLPALVFLRAGAYVGVIAGVRAWTEYLECTAELLASPTTQAPTLHVGDDSCHTGSTTLREPRGAT